MKKNILTRASQYSFMARAFVLSMLIASCGGDGGNNDGNNTDEPLSDKTTPVTFIIDNGLFYMFDYSGSRYIGSDTVEIWNGRTDLKNNVDIDLRQGKHHVLWMSGLSLYDWNRYSGEPSYIHFNPNSQTITAVGKNPLDSYGVNYAECDVTVKEYLLPKQNLAFKPLTANIRVEVTDYSYEVKKAFNKRFAIGVMKGYPYVSSTSLYGDSYTMATPSSDYSLELNDNLISSINSKSPTEALISSYTTMKEYSYESSWFGVEEISINVQNSHYILCPAKGLENIQLTAEVQDKNGNPITTTALPKISLRRGYTTVLRGPLFSGTTSDWMVTMEPYEEQ